MKGGESMKNSEYITRQLDPEEELPTQMKCRCERCGRLIRIRIGDDKLCILCTAEEKRARERR